MLIDTADIRVSTEFHHTRSKPGRGNRKEIERFSEQSRRRLLWQARNYPELKTILTITYPHEEYASTANGGDFMQDGRVVKDHLRKMRQVLTYHGISGFWFLEFQLRGAPHVHFFIDGWVSQSVEYKIRKTWHRMVGSDCPHHLLRGLDVQTLRKKHAASYYAAKYSTKDSQKIVPERYRGVGRFWGFFGKKRDKAVQIRTSMKEIYRLARVARNYAKARARSEGYKIRSPQGWAGYAVYYAAPVLRDYLLSRYTIQDIRRETPLELHTSQSLASSIVELGHTAKICGPPPEF